MTHAILPGRFDPPTLAHVALIQRAAALFTVTVAVAPDSEGQLLGAAQRVELLRQCVTDEHVRIIEQGGSDPSLLKALGGSAILRGMRPADVALGLPQPEVETIFLPAEPTTSHIRSRLVRDVVRLGGDPSPFVPPPVAALLARLSRNDVA